MSCARYGTEYEWRVATEPGGVVIRSDPSHPMEQPSLPEGVEFQEGMIGLRSLLQTKDGWLIGGNAGEFGGGLWFKPNDSSRTEKLLNENVLGIIATGNGVLILTGIAHLSWNHGTVFYIPTDAHSSRDVRMLVNLGAAPTAFARESDASLIVVTTKSVLRLTATGAVQILAPLPLFLYPYSVAIAPDGSIYVGMRFFVVRLVPSSKGYEQQYLLPDICRKFDLSHSDGIPTCRCKPGRKKK